MERPGWRKSREATYAQDAEDLFIPSSLVRHVMFSCWIHPATVFYGEAPRAQGHLKVERGELKSTDLDPVIFLQ